MQKKIRDSLDTKLARAVADPATLRGALEMADVVPALMVLAHLSGDLALLEEAAPYIDGPWDFQVRIPDALKARIRDRLVEVMLELHASGRPIDPARPPAMLQRIMSAAVAQEVPAEYVPLLIEELDFVGEDPRALRWRQPAPPRAVEDFKVIVVGAGISGICAGIRLKEAGIPFVILEKNRDIGGTWYENTYPGCGVDTANHFYSFSFAPKDDWSRHFSKQPEIQEYLVDVVERYDLRPHIRFGVEVSEMVFDDTSARWRVSSTSADGLSETDECNVLISAVGLLNRPAIPKLPGLENFRGPKVHTANWDHDVSLAGKSVALIGTGASAMQVGPEIAPQVKRLTIFQRTPHWVANNPNYHREVGDGQRWALQNIPLFTEWQRYLLFWGSSDGFHASLHMDPGWTRPEESLNAENHKLREHLVKHIRSELEGREDLIAKCIPGYPPYGKRMLRDNHWYKTLLRPNVELVSEGIKAIDADSITTHSGARIEVDAIIFATGFHAERVLWPMKVRGARGVDIRDRWGMDDPRAYKGMTVPGFPNFFILTGPNTALAHGGSIVFHTECQVRYVLEAVREMIEGGRRTVEVREDVHDAYNVLVDEKCRQMVWSHPGVTSWYKNKAGRITVTSPWRLVDYWAMTREFAADEYLIE
jgi:4-hydroxyacetophenone monooxygenase